MRKILKTGTRPSPLALKQVKEIKRRFLSVDFVVFEFMTFGDKDRLTPISEIEGSDFFTREIDHALLSAKIDLAVHSSKDLADPLPAGLAVVLQTESISPYDALVSRGKLKFRELAEGSRIGTSSLRRKRRVKFLRPDLKIVDIRGNIDERLSLIDAGEIDALIIAHAALLRLGLEEAAAEVFPLGLFQTHPEQGSLSLLTRKDRWQEVKSILSEPARATGN